MTIQIRYPHRFADKLAENRQMRAAVDSTGVDFDAWLRDSKLPFFPDYTDHGPEHLTGVLETAESLVADSAWETVTAEDVGVFILAVLLHDAALHLSEAGFQELIRGRAAGQKINGFDALSWPDLWQDFLFSARHWDGGKLAEVFGEAERGVPGAPALDPFEHYEDLRESDRKLIGEFIRQHHPRMAHEFAVFGVPGPSADPIRPNTLFGPKKIELAGLVARSHGLPVRVCVDYLKDRYHQREYQNVHVVFLMTLLRIADYLQIQADRASSVAFRYKNIASPRSRLEHRAHQAVTNITWANEDPESLMVQAEPQELKTFLHLKDLVTAIQDEFDNSWAVLGEVYGSDRKLSKLGLKLRRIRSNLEDAGSFARHADFFPARVELDVAHAEIMKLMVRPLYGSHPGMGVRELLQNSLDAVREIENWLSRHSDLQGVPRIEQDGDVEIWLMDADEEHERVLIVSDRGIGMTEEVIRDYFLRVGASYRESSAWRREFGNRIDDDSLRHRVLRSGRFGIGVLAAFLLGEEIEISTRHVSSSRGITFRTRLEPGPIELRYTEDLKVGTTVKVRLGPIYLRGEEWDWYCLELPRVLRFSGIGRKRIEQSSNLPGDPENLPIGWYRVNTLEYTAVYVEPRTSGPLVCNGIRIGDRPSRYSSWFDVGSGELRVATPTTVVLDAEGRLPLDLTRANLTASLSFVEEVGRVVCESILAGILLNTPDQPPVRGALDYMLPRFDRSWMEMVSFSPWLITPGGVALADAWNVLEIDTDEVLVSFAEGLNLQHSHSCLIEGSFIYGEDNELEALLLGGILEPLKLEGARLLVTASYADHLLRLAEGDSIMSRYEIETEWTDGKWSLITYGRCRAVRLDLESLPEPGHRSSIWPVAVEWFFQRRPIEPTGVPRYWRDIFRLPFVPFNPEERKSKLVHAYERLHPYFEEHRNPVNLPKMSSGSRRRRRY